MPKLTMTLNLHRLQGEATLKGDDRCFHGIYVLDGRVEFQAKAIIAGDAFFARGQTSLTGNAFMLQFSVSPFAVALQPTAHICAHAFEQPTGKAVIRLDQVSFPPKARAYRHIHPGAGIRWLKSGALEIKSDHETTMMDVGSAWFEDANAPVQATAHDVAETAFIRMLVLPQKFLGKPTIKLLNPEDEDLPKRQTNTRFFDEPVDF